MNGYQFLSALLGLVAIGGVINYRWWKLHPSIGMMIFSMLVIGGLMAVRASGLIDVTTALTYIHSIDFPSMMMNLFLPILVFASAFHLKLGSILEHKWSIGVLATVGVVIGTFVFGVAFHYVTGVTLMVALIIGSIACPTDPIAVSGIMKTYSAPNSIRIKVEGESLFNDGTAVVLFQILMAASTGLSAFDSVSHGIIEAVGGMLFGLISGYVIAKVLHAIDDSSVELCVTLATSLVVYHAAGFIHVSGLLAVACAALVLGEKKSVVMNDTTQAYAHYVWDWVDATLTAVLFFMMGITLVDMTTYSTSMVFVLVAIILAFVSRYVSVAVPLYVMRLIGFEFHRGATRILVFGGLRGGISMALALMLPVTDSKEMIVTCIFGIVAFTVIGQGMTMPYLLRSMYGK